MELTDEKILGYAAVSRYYVGASNESKFVECVREIFTEYLASLTPEKVKEEVAKLIYTEKKKHSIRLPEAIPLPTWEQLYDKTATLAGYNERLIDRYLQEAGQILSIVNAQFQLKENEVLAVVEKESELPEVTDQDINNPNYTSQEEAQIAMLKQDWRKVKRWLHP